MIQSVPHTLARYILKHRYKVDESGMNIRVHCRYCRKSAIDNDFFTLDEEGEHYLRPSDKITHHEDCPVVISIDILGEDK